ncbi:MAG TPA: ATP synthase subunit I [bacterium]
MNFNLKKFLVELIGISLVVLLIILVVVHFVFKQDKSNEIFLGYLISLFIFVLGFISINWAFDRSLKTFMGIVLGGMFLRFVLIGVALFLLIRFTNIHIFSFVLAFFVFYIIYQFYEIRFINVKLSKGKKWLEVFKGVS